MHSRGPFQVSLKKSGYTPQLRSILFLLSITLLSIQCTSDDLFAPTGAHVDVVASSTTLGADGDSALIEAFVTESDGHLVDNGTVVTFLATGGGLCETTALSDENFAFSCPASPLPQILTQKTRNGLVRALFRAGSGTTAMVKAKSGSAEGSVTFTISSLVAPTGSNIVLTAIPDTISVGTKSRIVAYLTLADGSEIKDGTRVVFSTNDGTLSNLIAITIGGFAHTVFTATKAGPATISLKSGTVHGDATLVVQ